jgi:hypothetical protein
MAVYVFQCCGRSVTVADDSASSVSLPHLCVGDVPCIGIASATSNVIAAAQDVQTEVVDPVTGAVDGTDGGTTQNGDGQ